MRRTAILRTRAWVRACLWVSVALTLAAAGAAGLRFTESRMDLVLVQLTFYGAWAALLGSWAGGLLGAAVEEDACGELDMGVTSSMGALVGVIAVSLATLPVAGLALGHAWQPVWVGALGLTLLVALAEAIGLRAVRRSGHDPRGVRVDAEGRPEPDAWQPMRMRDRFTVATTAAVLVQLALVGFMVVDMGRDLGHPVMMAPMMYGMTGGMLGGLLGGWLAGLRDEHVGAPAHENAFMVAAMALMTGMMGAMPTAMVAGMMAVMGVESIVVTAAAGLVLGVGSVALILHGRYALRAGRVPEPVRWTGTAEAVGTRGLELRISGMTCAACGHRVTSRLQQVPGVTSVQVDVAGGRAALACDAEFPGIEAVTAALEEIGYPLARG